ncbi:amidase [Propionibacteriaceae bacterium ES.041]|uniref:amidase n=1 Tax=Enemella evansiae TaxID=2016499 RepID=UPI000BF303DE|nr:amidase [Enemella evansiae]PFG65540.1 amidase [Propionibacteriaceae bacterium ES.041]TDO91556.1 amidase [Enemella evansiae]
MTDPELCFLPATRLAAAIADGEISSREATEAFLTQIEHVNPRVNAVITLVAEQALDAAARADDHAANNDDLPVLHGVPMLHKDVHDTAGIRTTQGSPIFADHVPATDDLVIERLHAAGVITLGKTNVPEFAAGSHTFNPVFGRTDNPYDTSRSAGGSSGGQTVALATGMTPLGDGTDLGGSLRNPAAFCNVVGLRPSPGRVPQAPDGFGQYTLTTSGPLARSVDDVALLLSAMAGPDLRAPASLSDPGSRFRSVPEIDPRQLRVAVSADFGGRFGVDPQIVGAVRQAAETLASLGVRVDETLPDLRDADEVFRTRRAWQFASNLGRVVDRHPDRVKKSVHDNVAAGRTLTVTDLTRAMVRGERLYQRMREFFTGYDALLVPTTQVLPFDAELEYPTEIAGKPMANYLEWMRSCSDITATGMPALSLPGGFSTEGWPIGVQLVAGPRADLRLLSVAKVLEQATRYADRRPGVLDDPAG